MSDDAFVLESSDRFPAGTSVSVYPAQARVDGQRPVGQAITSAVVSPEGRLTFTGLSRDTRYAAYAQVEGQHRYVAFATFHSRSRLFVDDGGHLYDAEDEEIPVVGTPGQPGPSGPAGPAGQDAVSASDAVRGEPDRFYRVVAGAVRFTGTTWELVNDAFSRPQNIDGITVDHRKITVDYTTLGVLKMGDFAASIGENLASVGIRPIVKRGLTKTEIRLQQDRRLSDFAYWDGAAWVLQKGAASPFTLSGLAGVSTDYIATVLATPNIVSAYRFSEASGAVLTDASPNSRNGVIVSTGATYQVAGGVVTDAGDDAITTAAGGTNEFTFSLMSFMTEAAFSVEWVGKVLADGTIIFRDNAALTSQGYWVAKNTVSGKVQYRVGTAPIRQTDFSWATLADGNTHQVVLTKSAANYALYIDGTLISSAADGTATALSAPWHFGRTGHGGSTPASQSQTVTEASFYARALTAVEVQSHHYAMSATGQLHVAHENVGDANPASVSLTPRGKQARPVIGSAVDSVRTTGFDVEFYDATNTLITAATADMRVGLERSVNERLIDPQALAVRTVVQAEDNFENTVRADDPIAHVRLGEASGSTAVDAIGTLDGTVQAGVTLGATGLLVGDADTAAAFDGAQGKIAFPNPALTGAFSIEVLFKPTGAGSVGLTTYGTIIGWGAPSTRRLMYNNSTGGFLIEAGGVALTAPAGTAALSATHHLVYTWDLLSQKLYVDGNLIVESVTSSISLNTAFFLGSYLATSANYSFKGTIDELLLYRTALSRNQIQQHYATAAAVVLNVDRSVGSAITFQGLVETGPPPVIPPTEQPLPEKTPLPVGDLGAAALHNVPLEPYRAQIAAASSWVKRVLPNDVPGRNAVVLASGDVVGWPAATSTNWIKSLCDLWGIDENSPGRDPVIVPATQGGNTPMWLRPGEFIYVVPDDQPKRTITDTDASVSGWASHMNQLVTKMGGWPIPADARPHFTQDRYCFVYQPTKDAWFTIYDFKGSDLATTTMALTGSPSGGGFFLKLFYLDHQLQIVTQYFTQTYVPYNATAAQVQSAIQTAKTTGNALFSSNSGRSVVTGGPLNVAPITVSFPLCEALMPVGMQVTDNFLNSGSVEFAYHNAGPLDKGRLNSVVTPSVDGTIATGASTFIGHYSTKFDALGFMWMDTRWMATATGIDFFDLVISPEEYQTALANGTNLGHVMAMSIGDCQGYPFNAVFPAKRGDGTKVTADGSMIVEGARIALPPDVDLSGVHPEFMPVARTLRDYGAIFIDKTGGGAELIFRRTGQHPGSSLASPWSTILPLYNTTGDAPLQYMRKIPWHKAQVIKPSFSA